MTAARIATSHTTTTQTTATQAAYERALERADSAQAIRERLHSPQLQADAVTTRTKARLLLALVSQLVPLLEQIKQYDAEITPLVYW
jgi:hypothetical protein